MKSIEQRAVDALRILSIDQVQAANSGHPGLPLGAAPMAYELWAHHLRHNPNNPNWINRDRFVLSAGHGSALLYALLHVFGYGDLKIADLKQFRQWDSLTPGHPEFGHTIGVEATTGPLGAGVASAVGMAMAQAHLAEIFNKDGFPILDHHTFALVGDGCLMEGLSGEALSLAGTLKLHQLIVLYDSNHISIEGSTDLAFQEDVKKRMESYGFQVLQVHDGNDLQAIKRAIVKAKAETSRPSFIEINTVIGYGSKRAGLASAHGEPLGVDNVRLTREALGWTSETAFEVSDDIYEHFASIRKSNALFEAQWNQLLERYFITYPEMKALWNAYFHAQDNIQSFVQSPSYWVKAAKPAATRAISGNLLQELKAVIPNFFGGSADLGPSNKTVLQDESDFSASNYAGKNIHFGVREHAMSAIANGMLLHGGVTTYVATFLVFSDFMKPMMRLASLMKLAQLYIFTHDSIGVGEDGPTHQPIEQLAMLRAQPNLDVFRPADEMETRAAYAHALTQTQTPTALILTRQNLPVLEGSSKEALHGAYVISPSKEDHPQAILIASGSEVQYCVEAQANLWEAGIDVRVVSMPCMELFDRQSKDYREHVLPKTQPLRLAVEAATSQPWYRFVGLSGKVIAMDHFGASAPASKLFEAFGFHAKNIENTVKEMLRNEIK
ncbi:MAG: transketolase [Erysipelotrichaceae bacterium]